MRAKLDAVGTTVWTAVDMQQVYPQPSTGRGCINRTAEDNRAHPVEDQTLTSASATDDIHNPQHLLLLLQ